MSIVYGTPSSGLAEPDISTPKANQACLACRKQKRKCNKGLPACALCARMNRHCDYSDASPTPTADQFNALNLKVIELEARLNGGNSMIMTPPSFVSPSAPLSSSETLGAALSSYNHPIDYVWQGIQNKFPAIAVLDKETFVNGRISIPPAIFPIPEDVLAYLGDDSSATSIANEYFATVHSWIPVVSQKRLMVELRHPNWEAGPDLALILLCMKLIISKPLDTIESYQSSLYISAKRFIAMVETAGTISLYTLQAGLLIMWYEFGQAIYPAAWLSAGWCIRYGNLLGINEHRETLDLLGRPSTWVEFEERRRTWWAVLVADRVVSIGSHGHVLNSQEPKAHDPLPVDESAWEERELSPSRQRLVSSPILEPAEPFVRLCQASLLLGEVLSHRYGAQHLEEEQKLESGNQLYGKISSLARQLQNDGDTTTDSIRLSAPLSLTYSALCVLYEFYDSSKHASSATNSPPYLEMQEKAIKGLKAASYSIVAFGEQVNASAQQPCDLDALSPIIIDSLYTAAANFAWLVRESGDEGYQVALDSLRHSLRRFGTRWRNAVEYVRILEAKEFTYTISNT